MIGRALSTTLVGIESTLVHVEAQITGALKRFTMVGLPDGVVRESRERVRCAIEQSGFAFPSGDVVISLSPATLPKFGSGFDLAIAVSMLAADGTIPAESLHRYLFLGELALDGSLRPARGALSAATLARQHPGLSLIVPVENGTEASLVPTVEVRSAGSLLEVVNFLLGRHELNLVPPPDQSDELLFENGFGDVVGQFAAKRALEICAAGAHSMLLVGVPGSGKSMLAARIGSLLPPLSLDEQIEVTKIYSAVSAWDPLGKNHARPTVPLMHGAAPNESDPSEDESELEDGVHLADVLPQPAREVHHLIRQRPFRSPHHSMSTAGLLGGGPLPVPGEISLAHRGVLFLDEVTEMRREALESLRQPLETKSITVSRARMRVTFPADFIFLAAMNPCPCGKRGIPDGGCLCTPPMISRYVGKISGPILDRIDLQIWVPPVPIASLTGERVADPTSSMRERVAAARKVQRSRGMLNSMLGTAEVREFCKVCATSTQLLEKAASRFKLSARGFTRVLRTARTIADLEGETAILPSHISEVLQYRLQNT